MTPVPATLLAGVPAPRIARLSTLQSQNEAPREGILRIDGPVSLHHGGTLDSLQIGWSLGGSPGQPVVLALGGISASRQVFDPAGGRNGWWSEIVGPGKALDTQRVAVLGMDYIGGSGGSSGPAAGGSFPSISSYDQAEAIVRLLDHLQIPKLAAIVGASYGGMVALAMSTYRSPEEFVARFRAAPRMEGGRPVFPVEEYLQARGRDYAQRTRPESFICLSESIDLHQVNATRVAVRTEVVAVREDQLVPIADMRALTARLPDARLHEFSSLMGHDAFLKEADPMRAVLSLIYPGDPT